MQGDFLVNTKDYGRVHNPYGSALLVSEHSDGYFELVIPLESIPSVFGDYETFDYNILTEKAKGLTKGKLELTAVTQEFLLTKENIYRLDQLKDKIYKYMVLCGNGVGYTFNAEISYKIADIDNGDNLKGELTITPSAFDEVLLDCRPFIRQTLTYSGTIPAHVTLTKSKKTISIPVNIAEGGNSESKAFAFNGSVESPIQTDFTVKAEDDVLIITATREENATAMVMLTATSADKMATNSSADKYAPCTLFIDVEYREDIQ